MFNTKQIPLNTSPARMPVAALAPAQTMTLKPMLDITFLTALQKAGIVLLGTVLLCLAAKAQVPFGIVKVSLQTTTIMLLSIFMGHRMALATVMLYLFEGAMGLPVFQGTPERGIGLVYMMGPTAGYLIGFLMAAVVPSVVLSKIKSQTFIKVFAMLILTDFFAIQLIGGAYLSTFIGVQATVALTLSWAVPTVIKAIAGASILSLARTYIKKAA